MSAGRLKKLIFLIEFSNSIIIKVYFKAHWYHSLLKKYKKQYDLFLVQKNYQIKE